MLRICFVITVFLVIVESTLALPAIKSEKDCFVQNSETVRVFITISSLYVSTTEQGIVKRQLEINWIGGDWSLGDSISLYRDDPIVHPTTKPILSFETEQYPGGYFRTDIEVSVKFFNLSTLYRHHCLGYWVAYHNNDKKIVSSSCLQIRPFWMEENAKHLHNLKLSEIMIPGSHDSGSFDFHKEIEPLSKFKYAQEESIFNQLVYGLRYFDLRVGYYKNSVDKYYINHGVLKTEHSVKSILQQVLTFIKATKEIVILDFHNFPMGFNNKYIHFKLIHLIKRTFGSYLIPHTHQYKDATFKEFWKQGKRVLVSYDNAVREEVFPRLMWPSIPRAWGNKQNPEDLETYFQSVFENPIPEGIWASMAELTPNTKTIVLHPDTGLRIFADKINKNVTHWFRDLYWKKANIVATDYFLGNDIIDVAIETNKFKGICPVSFWSNRINSINKNSTNIP